MPVQVTARVKGQKLLSGVQRLKLAIANLPAQYVRPEMEQARAELVDPYPDELPNQSYQRTGKRGERTRVESYAGNNQYSKAYVIKSDPVYNGRSADPYVLGDARGDGQAMVHRGRWKLIRRAVDEAMERIRAKAVELLETFRGTGGL